MAFQENGNRVSNGKLPAPTTPPLSPESCDSSSSSVEVLDLDCLSPKSLEESDSSVEGAPEEPFLREEQELEDGLVLHRFARPPSPRTPPLVLGVSRSDSESSVCSDDEKEKAESDGEVLDVEHDSLEVVDCIQEIPGPRTPPTASDEFPLSEWPSASDDEAISRPAEREPLLSTDVPADEEAHQDSLPPESSTPVETLGQPVSPGEAGKTFIPQSGDIVDIAEAGSEARSPLASNSNQSIKTPEIPRGVENLHELEQNSLPSDLTESKKESSPLRLEQPSPPTSTSATNACVDVESDREGSPIFFGQHAAKRVESLDSDVSESGDEFPTEEAESPGSDTSERSKELPAPKGESSELQEPSTSQEQDWQAQDEKQADINIDELVDELNVSESEDSDDDIAQIFGENSDDEDRDYGRDAGRASPSGSLYKDDAERDEETEQTETVISTDPDFVSDFDLMMAKRKAENRKRHWRRRNYDFISDSDDKINELINTMNKAAKADRLANVQHKPALSKRKLLPRIIPLLKRSDWQSALIDLGVVTSISEWLQLLPDKSLPAYEVRHELLKLLGQFPVLDPSVLRSSNIGKVVMLLYKHPKETKENKVLAKNLFREWLRPILNLQTDFSSLSREERMRRDYEHMPAAKKSRLKSIGDMEANISSVMSEKVLGPGDKGFIARARVPKPSTKDYVIRPKSNVEADFSKKPTKKSSSMDRKIREIKDRLKSKKNLKAVSVSIEGRKMLH